MSDIDWGNLQHVIEQGTAQACRDAGLQTFAVRVMIQLETDIHAQDIPVVTVEIIRLTPEEAAAVIAEAEKQDKNSN